MKILRIRLVIVLLVMASWAFTANAQTETILYTFGSSLTDGIGPFDGLVQGSDGDFYGTTYQGGQTADGTVFRIGLNGSYSNLYSFGSPPDGYLPYAALVQGSNGNFYGTTYYGGTNGLGTVFRISSGGAYINLYSFAGPPQDGSEPTAGLVQGSDGNFYGTTVNGGTNGLGTVFRISPNGVYTSLYSFAGHPTDGSFPQAGLVQGSDGSFYGTTVNGGMSTNCGLPGCGTVFRISPSGSYANLYSFGSNLNDGADPEAGLVQGSDGNFYGTTYEGGANGLGTVFRISPSGVYTSLYSFAGHPADGSFPQAGLVQGSDGNFYGTTYEGGANGLGTVFRISPSGVYTSLYSFAGHPADGSFPQAGLVQGSDGNFYGTTYEGGTNDEGTVFKLVVPLNPPPNQISGVQLSGTNIIFSIPSVAYETYQLQFSSSLTPANWINVPGASVTNCIGALLTVTNFGGAVGPQEFYRFAITP